MAILFRIAFLIILNINLNLFPMKNIKIEIIYSELFEKYPLLKKCYNYYVNNYSNNENIPKLFLEHKVISQNGEKLVYPIGIYTDKMIYILNKDNNYTIEEASLDYAIKSFVQNNPIILLNSKKISNCYCRYFSVENIKDFFKNENI